MLICNKYSKWYFSIIYNAKKSNRNKSDGNYYEKHHIFPICLYKQHSKEKWNLVLLTAKEHFICHWLLTKMFDTKYEITKMWYAVHRMNKISSWQYELARLANSKARKNSKLSEEHKSKLRGPRPHTKGIKKSSINYKNPKFKLRGKLSEEEKLRRYKTRIGRKYSLERKQNMSVSAKKVWNERKKQIR